MGKTKGSSTFQTAIIDKKSDTPICPRCKVRPKKIRKPNGHHKYYSYCHECNTKNQRNVQGYDGQNPVRKAAGICSRCHFEKRLSYGTTCKACRVAKNRNDHLVKNYGLSLGRYLEMSAEQGGVCAICLRPCRNHRNLSVDHDHKTGAVRGLLCMLCNQGLGDFGDDPAMLRKALAYLEER